MNRSNTGRLGATLLVACLAIALSAPGCQASKQGPALPPAGSMDVDMSAFKATGKADAAGNHAHHNNAALRVGLLNTSVLLALAVPRLVFAAALSQDPTFADGRWTWTFDAKYLGKPINATLTGTFPNQSETGTKLELEMRVTCKHCKVPTDDFVWYTGSFEADGSKGHWQFFNPEIKQDDKTFVKIGYTVTDPTHKTLTFSNLRTDGHADAGDVIAYKRAGDLLGVTVHDASKKLDYAAEVSLATRAGWLQVPGYNGGAKACWDEKHHNTDCK